MIVRDFLQWVRTAPASERAEATSALARAYLYSDLSADDLGAAEGAMLMLLDDPSPLVRRALADALAASPNAPPAIVHRARRRPAADRRAGLCAVAAISSMPIWSMRPRPAAPWCSRRSRAAPRCRARSPRPSPKSARRNPVWCWWRITTPIIAPFSIDRIVERFGHLAAIREALLVRDDLPAADAADAGHQAIRDARRLCRRPRLARRRSRAAHHARGLREGDRHASPRQRRTPNFAR